MKKLIPKLLAFAAPLFSLAAFSACQGPYLEYIPWCEQVNWNLLYFPNALAKFLNVTTVWNSSNGVYEIKIVPDLGEILVNNTADTLEALTITPTKVELPNYFTLSNAGVTINVPTTIANSLSANSAIIGTLTATSGSITTNLAVGNDLSVTNNITASNVTVTNSLSVPTLSSTTATIDSLTVNTQLVSNGATTVNGALTANNGLTVTGNALFNNNVSIAGNTTIAGNVTINAKTDIVPSGSLVGVHVLPQDSVGNPHIILGEESYLNGADIHYDNNIKVLAIGGGPAGLVIQTDSDFVNWSVSRRIYIENTSTGHVWVGIGTYTPAGDEYLNVAGDAVVSGNVQATTVEATNINAVNVSATNLQNVENITPGASGNVTIYPAGTTGYVIITSYNDGTGTYPAIALCYGGSCGYIYYNGTAFIYVYG